MCGALRKMIKVNKSGVTRPLLWPCYELIIALNFDRVICEPWSKMGSSATVLCVVKINSNNGSR